MLGVTGLKITNKHKLALVCGLCFTYQSWANTQDFSFFAKV